MTADRLTEIKAKGIWSWPHWLRHPFLVVLYFPFWRSVNAVRRGWIAAFGHVNLVTDDELMAVTEPLDCHPEGWDHPCMCAECRSYADAAGIRGAKGIRIVTANRIKYHNLPGFMHLPRVKRQDETIVYCARCGTAQTVLQVRLSRINDGYSSCCDDNLVEQRPINCLEPKR